MSKQQLKGAHDVEQRGTNSGYHQRRPTFLRYSLRQGLSVASVVIATGMLVAGFFVAAAFILAGLSDVTGSRLVAGVVLSTIALAIAAVLIGGRRSQAQSDTDSKFDLLSDWMRSFAIVFVSMTFGLFSSYAILALLLSMAEHRVLPESIGGALLEARNLHGPMILLGLVWLALQLGWIIPLVLRIYQTGLGQMVDPFRLAAIGGIISVALSVVATFALFALGPPSP